jgi:hypothetical protein
VHVDRVNVRKLFFQTHVIPCAEIDFAFVASVGHVVMIVSDLPTGGTVICSAVAVVCRVFLAALDFPTRHSGQEPAETLLIQALLVD